MFGIGTSESDGWAWTDARVAELTFTAPPVARDLNLILDAEGQVTPYTPHGQRVKITVNGQLIGDKILVDRREVVQLVIGREVWNRASPQTIVLELPDAIAPSTVGGSGDRRLLALRLHSLSFEPVAVP